MIGNAPTFVLSRLKAVIPPFAGFLSRQPRPRIFHYCIHHRHAATMPATTTNGTYATMASKPTSFQNLQGKIDPALLAALEDMKFETMSPVQQKVIETLPTVGSDW